MRKIERARQRERERESRREKGVKLLILLLCVFITTVKIKHGKQRNNIKASLAVIYSTSRHNSFTALTNSD